MLTAQMTTVEINYQMAKLRDEKQKLLERANDINETIELLAKQRTRQQLEARFNT